MGRAQELYFIKSYVLQTQKKVANAKHKIQRVKKFLYLKTPQTTEGSKLH